MPDLDAISLAEKTTELVAAYVANNHVQQGELPGLIASVHAALVSLGNPPEHKPLEPEVIEPIRPPMPIGKTITDDYLISLQDGKRYRSLKRHLAKHGLTPEQYRGKWGLPHDYPMVAPAYAAKRSEIAKGFGLGRRRSEQAAKAV